MKPRKHTRKSPCPHCGVKSGSYHNPRCIYAYNPESDHKTRQRITLRQRVRATLAIWGIR